MKNLSTLTKIYILGTILAGALLSGWYLAHLRVQNLWLLIALVGLASLTHVLKVVGPTSRSNYQISFMIYSFTLVLLGIPAVIFVILVAHLVEWVWHRYPWYVQCFNIGSFVVAISITGVVYTWFVPDNTPISVISVLGILLAMGVFTFINHLMIGLVLKLARGEDFSESQVFGGLPLILDFSLFGMGAGAAVIWMYNPFAVILVIIPLYLIYSTLKVPALERRAETDPKTGLYNAGHFNEVLEMELARADRFDRPITVVMADLDLLRNINNTYGHLAGDQVLIGVAQILQKSFRDYDVVARFGGEEFSVLMPETRPEQAISRIEDIRAIIEVTDFDIQTSTTPIRITMSFGIAGRTRMGQTPKDMIHSADLALYQSKLNGRNRVFLYMGEGNYKSMPITRPRPDRIPVQAETSQPSPEPPTTPASSVSGSAPRESKPVTEIKSKPQWLLDLYIGTVVMLAFVLLGLNIRPVPFEDWVGLAIFALLVLLAEGLSIDIYVKETSVSTSAAPLIAGILLFGPVGILVLSLVQAATALIKHGSRISRLYFNAGNQIIAGMLCYELVALTGQPFTSLPVQVQVGLSLLSAIIIYFSTTILITVAIDLNTGQPFSQVWAERFRWLAPFYLAMGLMAYALIFGYHSNGLVGVLVILVPLLLLRYSQKIYIDRTKEMVTQLRANNIELQQQSGEISQINEELLLALSRVIELRDPYCLGHSHRVASNATEIAKMVGLPQERIEAIRKAALLHDLGKLGIPEPILFKPSRLTPKEYETVKEHVPLAGEILKTIHSLHSLIPMVLHHHERYDGSGYPNGLAAEDILIEGRILALADALDAMASDRPYRRALNRDEIIKEIQDNSGTQFDPELVAKILKSLETGGNNLLDNVEHEHLAAIIGLPTHSV